MDENPKRISFLGKEKSPMIFPSTMDVLLDYFRVYVSNMEKHLEMEIIKTRQRYETRNDSEVSYLEEDLFVKSIIFNEVMRYSFMVSAYSILELGLRNRCQRLQSLKSSPFSVDEISIGGIMKYKVYLKRLSNVNISHKTNWAQLQNYGKLRNRIVHNLGAVKSGNKELINFIHKTPNLSINNDKFVVEKGACQEFIEIIKSFFKTVDSRLPTECSNLEPHFGFRP